MVGSCRWARLLTVAISFQIAFAPLHGLRVNYATAQSKPGSSEDSTRNFAAVIAETTAEPEVRDHMARMTEIANALGSNQAIELTPEERNTFRRLNQTVEITRPVADGRVNPANGEPVVEIVRVIDLNQLDVEKPNIAFSNIRYRIENGDLVIEATQGETESGRGGIVVARQRIPNLHLVTLTADEDLLVLVNKKGEVSALTMLELKPQLFTPLNVFERVAARKDAMDLSNAKVTAKFITPGVRPYDPAEVDEKTILPLNEEGKPVIHAGDLIVRAEVDGKGYVLGIFQRQLMLERALAGYHYLIREKTLVRPDSETLDAARKVFDGEMKNLDQIEKDIAEGRQTSLEAAALKTLSGAHLDTFVGAIQSLQDYKAKDYHGMTKDEWSQLHSVIEERAKTDVITDNKLTPEMRMEREWKRYLPQHRYGGKSQAEIESQHQQVNQEEKAETRASELGLIRQQLKKAVGILGGFYQENKLVIGMLAGVSAYMSVPFLMDIETVRTHLQFFNAYYHHLYPSVLLDQVYRVYMVKGMALLMTFPVLSMMASWGVGRALTIAAKAAGESTSKWAVTVREFNKKWGESALTNWQRVTSFGMRIWAQVIYPVWCRVPQLLRQKTFVSSLASGSNPFSRISPESDLGKSLKLTESLFVGINNPFLGKDDLERKAQLQRQAQGLLLEQKQRAKVMAMAIASLAVAGKTGIDPATLVYVAQNGAKAEDVREILSNGRTARSWYAVADAIQGAMLEMVKHGVNLNEVKAEELAESWKTASEAAVKLRGMSQGMVNAKYLMAKFRRYVSMTGPAILTYGTSEYHFLNNVFVNLKITENTKHQFTTDYALAAIQIPLVGGRADLTKPHDLAHSAHGFLYSTPGHLSEQAYQTFLYQFIVPARMAQVYQKVTVNADNTYTPSYQIEYMPDEKQERFTSGLLDGAYDVANFQKYGFGNIMLREWTKRLKTISGYLIVGLTMRSYFGEQALPLAFAGWALTEATAFFRYTWPWTIQMLAEMAGGDRVAENMSKLNAAQTKIHRGLRESNSETARQMTEQGYYELLNLYRTQSPQAWNGIKALVTDISGGKVDLVNRTPPALRPLEELLRTHGYEELVHQHETLVKNGKHYFGLVAGLARALQNGNESDAKQFEGQLRLALEAEARESQPELLESIKQMNAVTLLKFAAEPGNAPIFTKQNERVRNWAIAVCAFYTTYLAVGLSVDSFTAAKLTASYVSQTAAIFISAYIGLALATHQTTWKFIVETLSIARTQGLPAAAESVKEKARRLWYGENPEKGQALEQNGKATSPAAAATAKAPVDAVPVTAATTTLKAPALAEVVRAAKAQLNVSCWTMHLRPAY